jgi:gamma-glutamylaminecyclotransferase
MSDAPRERVFVYGTLKRGFCNHALLDEAEFIGEATTVARFGFYLGADDYAPEVEEIPYLYRQPKAADEAMTVHGEVWEISPATLWQLDQLEGHPDWYQRENIQVQMNSEATVEVLAYLRPGSPSDAYRPIEGGCF